MTQQRAGTGSLFPVRRRRPTARPKTARLAAEHLEQRLALASLPVTFTVPVEVANKGVYAAVFGNPTTTNAATFDSSQLGGGLSLANAGFYPATGQVTISNASGSAVVSYTVNSGNVLSGLTLEQGSGSYDAGSVVTFAGPDINQAPFVYLTSSATGPARTSTAAAVPRATVTPVLAGVLPVASTQGFAASGGSLTVYPPGQPGNTQTVNYTGIAGDSFTGVTCANGIGLNYVVSQGQRQTNTTAPIGPSAPTTIFVNSTAGFPSSGSLVAFQATKQVRLTYEGITGNSGNSGNSFTGVYFLDNSAIDQTFTIVEPSVLGSTIEVGGTSGFASSGQLLVQAAAGLPTSFVQTSTNVAVSYDRRTNGSFAGVKAFPSGGLPALPSGGSVYQLPGPAAATSYALLPSSGNLPLVSLFPNAGSIGGSGTTTATLTLPDPATTGILSGVIVLSVGTPIALPVTTKTVGNMGVQVNVATVGSPTPATNGNDVFGIFEWGLTANTIDFDVSEVDQVGFPFSVTTVGTAPPRPADPINGVGMKQDRATLFDGFTTFIRSVEAGYPPALAFLKGAAGVPNYPTVPRETRLTAPQDIIGNLVIDPPLAVAAMPAGQPGTGATASYWITAVSDDGESMPSLVVNGTSTGIQSALQISWQAYPYAKGYNVYWSPTNSLSAAVKITPTPVTGTSFLDTTPGSHAGSPTPPPANNYLYAGLNSYYTSALVDFFAYYAATGTTVAGVPGANNTFVLDDQATKTKWTGQTQTSLTIGAHSGYTALVLTGEAGTWGSQFAGKTIWVVMPLFSTNTNDASLGSLPPFPDNLTSSSVESGTAMVIAGDGVFGSYSASTDASFVSPGDSANLYNNVVSAFNRGLTPTRTAGGGWNPVLPPTYWANSPLLQSAVPSTTGGSLPAGAYRYWITAADINGTTGNQTTFSNVVEATTTQGTSASGTNSVKLTWNAINQTSSTAAALKAASFTIYRSQRQPDGTWSAPEFRAIVSNDTVTPVTTWSDTNAAATGTPAPLFNYYAPGTPSNYYAAYFADLAVSYNGLGYGYPYADKNGQSTNVQMPYPGGITGLNVTLNPWAAAGVLSLKPVPGTFTTPEDTSLNLLFTSGPFAEPGAPASMQFRAKLRGASGDVITASAGSGVKVAGSGTSLVAVTGSLAALNAYFTTPGSIVYRPAAEFAGTRTLGFAIRNLTTQAVSKATLAVNVTALNDAPFVTAPRRFKVVHGQPGNLEWPASRRPFADPDNRILTVTLAVASADEGTLSAASRRGVAVTGSGTNTMTFVGSAAKLNRYFQQAGRIRYTATGPSLLPRTLTITASDGSVVSGMVTRQILVTAPKSSGRPPR